MISLKMLQMVNPIPLQKTFPEWYRHTIFLDGCLSPDGLYNHVHPSVEPPREGFTRFINLVSLGDGLIQPGETVT